jgi:hypothetical protein
MSLTFRTAFNTSLSDRQSRAWNSQSMPHTWCSLSSARVRMISASVVSQENTTGERAEHKYMTSHHLTKKSDEITTGGADARKQLSDGLR